VDILPNDQGEDANCGSIYFGCGYYKHILSNWTEASATDAHNRLQSLIDKWTSYYNQEGIECIDFVKIDDCLFYTDDSTLGNLKCMIDNNYTVIDPNQPLPEPNPDLGECQDTDATDENGNNCSF